MSPRAAVQQLKGRNGQRVASYSFLIPNVDNVIRSLEIKCIWSNASVNLWTIRVSVTVGSFCKHWGNIGIFSGKRISFSGRKLFFCVKEAKVTCWGVETASSETQGHPLPSRPLSARAGRGARAAAPPAGRAAEPQLPASLAGPRVLHAGHNFHRITPIVPQVVI